MSTIAWPLSRPAAIAGRSRASFVAILAALAIALAITLTAAVTIGPVPLAPGVVWRIVLAHVLPGAIVPDWDAFQGDIIWEMRVPRALLGGLVGAGLALAGATLQTIVRNPLADPYLLGVSSGAALGVVSAVLLGVASFGAPSVSMAAFLGAIAAFTGVYALTSHAGRFATGRLILGGVAVSYVLSACTNALIYAADGERAKSALFWLLGGLGGARWSQLPLPGAIVVLAGALLFLQARTLNALTVGEEDAATLGVDPDRARRIGFVVASLLTGVLVAASGGIGFVGLMVPHVARSIVGADHRRLLPVAALAGAAFLMWADVLARTVIAPQELPIGIVTALAGAPFFVWLLRRADAAPGCRR